MVDTSIQVIRGLLSATTLGSDGEDGADGANGLNGAPGADGVSVELRNHSGWVQWRQEDDDPTWTNLYPIPSGETGEEIVQDKITIFAGQTIYHEVAATDKLLGYNFGANSYEMVSIFFSGRGLTAATSSNLNLKLNNDAVLTSNNYRTQRSQAENGAAGVAQANSMLVGFVPAATAPTDDWGVFRIDIYFSASAHRKAAVSLSTSRYSDTNVGTGVFGLNWKGTAALTRIDLDASGGNFKAGSEIRIVGYKEFEVVTNTTGTGVQGSPGADGIPGIDGADGVCDCDDGDFIGDLPNSAQNRCGVAVAVVASLKAAYQRVKLDPDAWDELQTLAGTVATVGVSATVATNVALVVFGVALNGVGVFGAVVGGAGTLLAGILGLTNDNTDRFTPTRELAMQTSLYCVLSRRETTVIDANVIREWISYIADVGFPAADLDMILGILAWTPITYWQNEARVAVPKINPCSTAECDSRSMEFSYKFSGVPVPGSIQFVKPLASALMQLITGTRNGDGIQSVPGFGHTRSFNVRVSLGRLVPVSSIIVSVAYKQTAAATSPVVTLTADGLARTGVVTGISEGFTTIQWDGLESISEFSISGTVATAGDFDDEAYLDLYELQYCGDGYPSFGVGNISEDACVPAEEDDFWCYKLNLLTSNGGLVHDTETGSGLATWASGIGWRGSQSGALDRLYMHLDIPSSAGSFLTAWEVKMSRNGTSDDHAFWASGANGVTTLPLNGTLANSVIVGQSQFGKSGIAIAAGGGFSFGMESGVDASSIADFIEMTLSGTGPNPFGEDNC